MKFFTFIKRKFIEVFHLDLRSLALFRIGMGIIILIDLATRAMELQANYTDWGAMPRGAIINNTNGLYFSFHMWSGLWQFQALLFLIAGFFALWLIVGYKTRLTTIISWIFLLSLHNRNTWIGSGADQLFRLLLFWSMFLPLGAKYSLDSVLQNRNKILPKSITNVATMAFILQLACIYIFTVFHKHSMEWQVTGTAVYYALHLWTFETPFGHFLKQFPQLLKILTHASYANEILAPYLLLFPFFSGPVRTCTVLFLIMMHTGFGFGLDLGLFSPLVIITLIGLLPSFFWNKVLGFLESRKQFQLTLYYDDTCSFCEKFERAVKTFLLLPTTHVLPASSNKKILKKMKEDNSWVITTNEKGKEKSHTCFGGAVAILKASPLLFPLGYFLGFTFFAPIGDFFYRAFSKKFHSTCPIHLEDTSVSEKPKEIENIKIHPLISFFLLFCLDICLLWNLSGFDYFHFDVPEPLKSFGIVLHLDQKWDMFSPAPPMTNNWFVIPGRLANGKTVNLFQNGDPVSWERPQPLLKNQTSVRWKKYISNLQKKIPDDTKYYAQYLCFTWNTAHGKEEQLRDFDIYLMTQDTLLDEKYGKLKKEEILAWSCQKK